MMNHQLFRCRVLCLLLLLFFAGRVLAAPAPTRLSPATETKLREILRDPALQDAHVGVSIVALGAAPDAAAFPSRPYDDKTQPVLFEMNADKRFMPASNMKLFTAAFALQMLGPEYVFKTTAISDGPIVGDELRGHLYLAGGGDPSLATADLEKLAGVLQARGIRHITGDIVGDGTRFQAETFGGRYPDGWTMDDGIWYYGPEINALAINRNQMDVTLTATRPGQPATMKVEPPYPQFPIENRVVTAVPDEKTAPLQFDRSGPYGALTNRLTISGRIAPGQTATEGVAVPAPALWAATLLRQALRDKGIAVSGNARQTDVRAGANRQALGNIQSPPLRVLLQRFLKKSDNLYAEMLLRATSLLPQGVPTSSNDPHSRLLDWLQWHHIPTRNLRFEDGSGLSRYNLLTPRALTSLLSVIETQPGGEAIYSALPIAGVDGTLKKRMQSTPAAGNVHAKTGSFSIASNLSGYVTTRDGQRLAVSMMTNFARDTDDARRVQDEIFTALADAKMR
jgi:D-alanyl-D-alanine carboxypeptidase/D-alanyl-D-alanine-endopeptidase (penicillin-binding protein 4)